MRERRKQKNIKKRALRSKQFNRVRDIRKQDIRNLWELCKYGATYKRLQQLTMGRNIMKINERNFLFDTPLHIACRHGQYEVVKFLLHKRAQVNVVSDSMQKITPLHEAMYSGHFDCAELLLQNGANASRKRSSGLDSGSNMYKVDNNWIGGTLQLKIKGKFGSSSATTKDTQRYNHAGDWWCE